MTALIHELLIASADGTPDARALKFRKDEIAYADIGHGVERFAHALVARGLQKAQQVTKLATEITQSPDLGLLVVVDSAPPSVRSSKSAVVWEYFQGSSSRPPLRVIDTDLTAIQHTPGSAVKPTRVVFPHRSMVN